VGDLSRRALADRKTDTDGKPLPPPVLLRTYVQLERLPEGEEACQAAWQRASEARP
jgi:hypothetical protein